MIDESPNTEDSYLEASVAVFFLDSVIFMSCWKPKKSSFIIPFWLCCPQTSQRQLSSNLPPQSRLKLSHTHLSLDLYAVCVSLRPRLQESNSAQVSVRAELKKTTIFSNNILCRAPVKSLTSPSLPLNRLTTERNITTAAGSACKSRFLHLLPQFPRKAVELRGWDSKWWCSGGVTAHFPLIFFNFFFKFQPSKVKNVTNGKTYCFSFHIRHICSLHQLFTHRNEPVFGQL